MISIVRLLGRPLPPDSFESWYQAVIPQFLYLRAGRPDAPEVHKHQKWLKSFARWKTGYEGFLQIERTLERRGRPMNERDRRSREYYSALLLQSGQWHATLLLLVKDVSEQERVALLAQLDRALPELRKRIANP